MSDVVLIADDSPINQRVAGAMVEHLGYAVEIVADGAAAVEAASATPFLAILMDCQMPVMDGYAATAEIRRREGASRRVPIVALTGSTAPADHARCLDAGMDGVLSKPLHLKTLSDAFDRWVLPTPPEATTGPAVLDPGVVARMSELSKTAGQDVMAELAALFLTGADAQVAALRQALADGDRAAVTLSAHTLRGSSLNVGATVLAEMCTPLEDGNLADATTRLDAVVAELARVRDALAATSPGLGLVR